MYVHQQHHLLILAFPSIASCRYGVQSQLPTTYLRGPINAEHGSRACKFARPAVDVIPAANEGTRKTNTKLEAQSLDSGVYDIELRGEFGVLQQMAHITT